MAEAVRMCIGNGVGNLNRDLHRAPHVHRTPGRLRAQRLSFLELEREVDAAVVFADIEERGDIGMRQRAQAARAGDQALTIDREIFRQQSNGNRSSELRVARAKEISRARRLEPLEQVVVRDDADWRGRRFSHERSASITLCTSSFASLICSSTIEMSIVGLPGCRALWQ